MSRHIWLVRQRGMANRVRGQDTPAAVARLSSSRLRASALRQAAVNAAVVPVVVVAAAADIGTHC
jgi:hypothetical protein